MIDTLTPEAIAAMKRVAAAQAEFWDALSEAESELGTELEGTSDMTGLNDEASIETFFQELQVITQEGNS